MSVSRLSASLPLLVLPLLAAGGGASDLSAETQALIVELTHDHRAKALSAANGALAGLDGMVQVPVSTAALGWLHQALATIYLFEDDEAAAHQEWRLACAISSASSSFHPSLPPEDKPGWAAECATLTAGATLVAHVPSGATLYVDGREQTSAKVPVKPGQHLMQVLGGSSPNVELVTLAAGGSATVGEAPSKVAGSQPTPPKVSTPTVVTEPEPPTQGFLYINSVPISAKVYLDGVKIGVTPIQGATITVGKHILRLEQKGYATESRIMEVTPGKDLLLGTLQMSPVAPRQGLVVLSLPDAPVGTKVFMDDMYVGELPSVNAQLNEGSHEFRVVGPDGMNYVVIRDVDFAADGEPLPIDLSVQVP